MTDRVMEVQPGTPRDVRALVIMTVVAGCLDERLLTSFITSGYRRPDPLAPPTEPYPGYADVHSFYMTYQEEFVEWYRKHINKGAIGAAAGTL
ncbi:hypothetical protein ACGFNU_25325 [Spirillospora sp. NPDC048911]|uniref:hypothetical protein n=1 Tax=Spirillospora sp. NPDC048911 TaxID=3364527 RepID=UPI00371FAA1B